MGTHSPNGHHHRQHILNTELPFETKSMRLGHLFYKQYNLQHTYAPSQKNIMIIWTTFCNWIADLWLDPELVSPKKLWTLPLIRLISFSLAPINSCHYFCQNPPSPPDQPSAQKTNLSLVRSLWCGIWRQGGRQGSGQINPLKDKNPRRTRRSCCYWQIDRHSRAVGHRWRKVEIEMLLWPAGGGNPLASDAQQSREK